MTRRIPALLLLAAAVYAVLLWLLAEDDEPDEMAQPFLDSRNSATYLYNARTGVISSYN